MTSDIQCNSSCIHLILFSVIMKINELFVINLIHLSLDQRQILQVMERKDTKSGSRGSIASTGQGPASAAVITCM